ncbi:hypothetical protein [uncultured Maritimibacter sp.]|uniref:hypothetical protein n=1 Tax=uncultured Maritimibacter sp. TaxID=991866 RepID=UPI002592BB7E|nr:hypothetical protein [uncultured Maritimibacter sp.]
MTYDPNRVIQYGHGPIVPSINNSPSALAAFDMARLPTAQTSQPQPQVTPEEILASMVAQAPSATPVRRAAPAPKVTDPNGVMTEAPAAMTAPDVPDGPGLVTRLIQDLFQGGAQAPGAPVMPVMDTAPVMPPAPVVPGMSTPPAASAPTQVSPSIADLVNRFLFRSVW